MLAQTVRSAAARMGAMGKAAPAKMTVRGMAGASSQHRPTDVNQQDGFFDFTPENYQRVATILAKVSALCSLAPGPGI